jgi:methyltransferase-like protein
VASAVVQPTSAFGRFLQEERDLVRDNADFYLLHDHLEHVNDPIYFRDFVQQAQTNGLRYLGESNLRTMVPGNFPRHVEESLRALAPDNLGLEQCMDFLRNRMFRETLLCHARNLPVYNLQPERLDHLHVASPVRPQSTRPDLTSTNVEKFEGRHGVTLSCREPLAKAVMLQLAEIWPETLSFELLFERAQEKMARVPSPDPPALERERQFLRQYLLRIYTSASTNLLELHVHPPHVIGRISARPMVSPLARLQAQAGNKATNQHHQVIMLDEVERQLLCRLDGQCGRQALVDVLADLAVRGVLQREHEDFLSADAGDSTLHLERILHKQLAQIARHAFLIA